MKWVHINENREQWTANNEVYNNELVIGLETYPNEGATNNFFLLLKVKLFRKTTDELTWWLWLKEKLKCIENELLNLPIEKE